MIEIEKPQIECIETPGDATYGKYVVEPLERGYGTTLGNALRRIMLSSLPGTAPTTIKIAGVQHEFSTIPGVKEDVTEIVLNIKGIIAKLHCDGPKTVYIEAAGDQKEYFFFHISIYYKLLIFLEQLLKSAVLIFHLLPQARHIGT